MRFPTKSLPGLCVLLGTVALVRSAAAQSIIDWNERRPTDAVPTASRGDVERARLARGENPDGEPRSPPLVFRLAFPGTWQVRGVALSNIPLSTTPGIAEPTSLGQNAYLEQWFRFTPEMSIGGFRLIAQFDVARGILIGQSTEQVELSRDSRTTNPSLFPRGPFDLRWLYIDWTTPIGIIRAGQQPSHWGLGIVANDGNHTNVFGDYRMGDIAERIAFATRPGGRNSDLVLALAGDLTYRDRIAFLVEYPVANPWDPRTTRMLGRDWSWQAIASVFYQQHDCTQNCDRHRIGVYAVYRSLTNRLGDFLRAFVSDVHMAWDWPTPDGQARVFARGELAVIVGQTSITQNQVYSEHAIVQFGGAVEAGVERDNHYRLSLEAGYASGDQNPADGAQRRFTFNPDHRIGLVLFPELIAWQTARSASIASDLRILGIGAPGAELLPTSGGVTNAAYLYPTFIVNLQPWLDVRAGMVLAVASSDWVDPIQLQLSGNARNYRGGNSRARDLGLELDLGLMANRAIGNGVNVSGGVQGGVLFPGHAFDDAAGRGPGVLGTVIGRAGLTF